MTETVLDTGALIALERANPRMLALMLRAKQGKTTIAVPANVVAQAWRDGRRQARIAMLLGSDHTEIVNMDFRAARDVGELCGSTGVSDVVDVSVMHCARQRQCGVVTSDPDDLSKIDNTVPLLTV